MIGDELEQRLVKLEGTRQLLDELPRGVEELHEDRRALLGYSEHARQTPNASGCLFVYMTTDLNSSHILRQSTD